MNKASPRTSALIYIYSASELDISKVEISGGTTTISLMESATVQAPSKGTSIVISGLGVAPGGGIGDRNYYKLRDLNGVHQVESKLSKSKITIRTPQGITSTTFASRNNSFPSLSFSCA